MHAVRVVSAAPATTPKGKRKCPNCGNRSLEFFLGEWACHECEYHSKKLTKNVKKSFR